MQSSRWCIGYDRAANDARPRWINARRPAVRRSSSGLHDALAELFEIGHYGRVLRYVLLRDALRNLSLEPSAGCRAVNHLGLTGSDPLQG
jgi:hypothetical protein